MNIKGRAKICHENTDRKLLELHQYQSRLSRRNIGRDREKNFIIIKGSIQGKI